LVKVVASAPGKVTLFGEHAVVYGYPAIVTAIGRRVWVTAEPRGDDAVVIAALDLRVPGVVVTYRGNEVIIGTDYGKTLSAVAYLRKAIEITSDYLGARGGVNLTVRSEMPVGAGLGTSAAVSVATIAAYSKVLGYDLRKDEIARLGWEVEKAVQGIASPMDTSIASFGGTIKIWKEGEGGEFVRKQLSVSIEEPLIIGYVERQHTTAEMVKAVKSLKERYGELVELIMKAIGRLTEEAENALLQGDVLKVGTLMNVNHGLLEALNVSTMKLSQIVYAARAAGALGAKLTGAGGGGAVIALASRDNAEKVELAVKLHSSITLKTTFGAPGVTVRTLKE